jgi:hypothetical protein
MPLHRAHRHAFHPAGAFSSWFLNGICGLQNVIEFSPSESVFFDSLRKWMPVVRTKKVGEIRIFFERAIFPI